MSETKPLVGKTSKKLPPPNKTINPIPKTNPGMEYPIRMNRLVVISNLDPCVIAFFIPRGIQTE